MQAVFSNESLMVDPAITNNLTSHTHFLIELHQQLAADPSPEAAIPQILSGIQQVSGAACVRLVLDRFTFEAGTAASRETDDAIYTYVAEHGALPLSKPETMLPGLARESYKQAMAEPLYVRDRLIGVL